MRKPKPITNEELKAIMEAEMSAAMGENAGELAEARMKAMDRYLGEPRGDELEGRSQVQGRDITDVIEWILPSLIKMFVNPESSVVIEPVGPEDEEQAEQETDVINHIFWKKNEGFLIMYSWFKDALLSKNGITKNWVEENEVSTRHEFEGLLDVEFQALMANKEFELVEHSEGTMQGDMGPVRVHDTVFRRTRKKNDIMVDVIAPEEFLISTDADSPNPKKARFCAHYTEKSISDLREMGFSDADINLMENGISHDESEEESYTRKNLDDELRYDNVSDANEAMRTKKITEAYLKADKDGDGRAELLQVFYSGDFIQAEETDKNPFNALTPVILTHKFFGLSIADLLFDIQDIRTSLLRSYLDNFNQSINGTTYYNENTVNVDDMLTSSPFGIRAVDGPPGQDVLHIPASGLPPQSFSLDEMLDKMRADRIGDIQSQLDPNVLANANNGVVVEMLNEAKAKVEMIARIFAETGVKHLFRDIHDLMRQHGDKDLVLKLRGNWVPVNPTTWQERTDFTVKVGLGNRNKQEEAASISGIMDRQMQMVQLGMMAPIHLDPQTGQPVAFPLYESHKRFAEIMGEKNPEKYFPNPMKAMVPPPPQEQQPDNSDILALTAQVEAQKDRTKQVEIQMKNQIDMGKLNLEEEKLKAKAAEAAAKQSSSELKIELEGVKMQSDNRIKELEMLLKSQQDDAKQTESTIKAAIQAAKDEQDRALEKYKADLNATTSLVNEQAKQPGTDPQAQALIASLVDQVQTLQTQLNAPKKLVRDENGQVIQVGNQKVIRENGIIDRLE